MLFFDILTNNWLVYKKSLSTIDIYICYKQGNLMRIDINIPYLNDSINILYLDNNTMTKMIQTLDNN